MRRSAFVALPCLALLACTPTNVNGTLRGNQVVLFEGQHWTDVRCSESRGSGLSPLNCCSSHGQYCLDFVDYVVSDVRVQGQRVAVLVTVNNGHMLYLSDDLGASWRAVNVGSIGGIAEFQATALHLSGDRVFLMVQTKEEAPLGGRVVVYPWEVNLAAGGATRAPLNGASWLFARPHAWSAPDGSTVGVTLLPEDARDPGGPCLLQRETWSPAGSATVQLKAAGFNGCVEQFVPASDDGRFFPLVDLRPGVEACVRQYDLASDTVASHCVPWSRWPAAIPPDGVVRFAAGAGKRAWRYVLFTVEDTAWAVTPTSPTQVSLGRGAPQNNRRTSGRQPFAGLVPLKEADGTSRLLRINEDETADEVLLPLSPCVGDAQSCFDPKNADVFHGEVGDVHWVEPLGGDEYLVFYAHDVAPGINQVKLVLTVSREQATHRRVVPLEKPMGVGPAGYPNAKPAGPLERWCLRRAACTGASFDFYQCVGAYLSQQTMTLVGLDAAVAEADVAGCESLLVRNPQAFDCRARGGTPTMRDDGQGQLFLECGAPVDVTGAACNTCVGDVAVTCLTSPFRVQPVDCALAGATCQAGRCVPPAPCSGPAETTCAGDVGVNCFNGEEARARCDLLNMTCSPQPVPGWAPCVGKGEWAPSTTNVPVRCDGDYLLWHLNGEKWAHCVELGFTGCQGGRCAP